MPANRLLPTVAALVLPLLLAPALAHADDDDKTPAMNLMSVGFAVGSGEIADVSGTAIGVHFDAGHSFGALHLQLEYMIGGFSETQYDYAKAGRGAFLQRAGVLARYHFFDKFIGEKFRFNVWLEAGLGREWWQWTEGGKLDRDVLTFGFGTGFLGNLAGYGKKAKWMGAYYDFRFTLADNPYARANDALVCAGPCEEPTGPVPFDFQFTFVLGFNFGR
jgi:hypothetical protein